MTSIATHRTNIAAALTTAISPALKVYAYRVPNPQFPCAIVAPETGEYAEDFEDGAEHTFVVSALWRGDDWEIAQEQLDGLVPMVVAALGNLHGKSGPVSYSDYGSGSYAGDVPVYGVRFRVSVTD